MKKHFGSEKNKHSQKKYLYANLAVVASFLFSTWIFSYVYGFGAVVLLLPIILLGGPVCLILLLTFFIKRDKVKMLGLLGITFAFCFGIKAGTMILNYRAEYYEKNYVSKDVESREKIIEAIDQYQKDNVNFPENLQLLVPKYLPTVPKTALGKNFAYIPSPRSFILSYPIVDGKKCYWFGLDGSTYQVNGAWSDCIKNPL